MEKADWTLEKIAEENHNLNEGYFRTGSYKKYPSFYKITDAFNFILENDSKRPLEMLDCGCGAGWTGVYLEKEGFLDRIKYSGCDLSKHMCAYALLNVPSGIFFEADITKNALNKHDVVYEGAVLELVEDWKAAAINMARSSNKWLIFHRLYVEEEKETRVEQVKTYLGLPDIRTHISVPELKQILSQEGFEIVKTDIWGRNKNYVMGTYVARRIDAES